MGRNTTSDGLDRTYEIRERMLRESHSAAAARRALYRLDALDEAEFEITCLLMSELINNAVLHAGPGAGERFTLNAFVTGDMVRVAVTDGGPGFEVTGVPRPADDGSGQWGLSLVNELADRWGISMDGDTSVWFELDRV